MAIEDYIGKIINTDCMDILKQLPDKCIDLVLTDPPYGIGEAAGKNKSRGGLAAAKDYGNKDWDNKIPDKEIFEQIKRISKKQIIFGGNYFVEYLNNSSCWLVWDKNNGNNDFADCELAWTNFKSAVRKYFWTWNGMFQQDMKNKDIRIHPTQKPLKLFEIVEPDIIKHRSGRTDSRLHFETLKLPPKERSKIRSKTFVGIAKAMAEQWG